jgi:hypothetical protein
MWLPKQERQVFAERYVSRKSHLVSLAQCSSLVRSH